MARSRNIKPGFFTNEELGALDPLARLLFAGLWTEADRKGVLEDRPARLKPRLLPFDDCDVDALLDELQRAKFILRYESDGKSLIYVLNFVAHQNPHHTEKDSSLQSPTVQQVRSLTDNIRCVTEKIRAVTEDSQDASCEFPPDSLLLIPDSLPPSTVREMPKRKEPTGEWDKSETFTECWERHKKHSGRESLDLVSRMLIGRDRLDWAQVKAKHPAYCAYWAKNGWNFCPLTFLQWIDNGMPDPPEAAEDIRMPPPSPHKWGEKTAFDRILEGFSN